MLANIAIDYTTDGKKKAAIANGALLRMFALGKQVRRNGREFDGFACVVVFFCSLVFSRSFSPPTRPLSPPLLLTPLLEKEKS